MSRNSAYYYLCATLPSLAVGAPIPIPIENIEASAALFLDPVELALFRELDLLSRCSPKFPEAINTYLSWEQTIRNRLVFLRCFKAGVDPDVYIRPDEVGVFAGVDSAVHEFFNLPTLDKEQRLDNARWRALNYITAGERFNFAAVCAYKLRYEIAKKWVVRKPETGRANLDRLVGTVAGKVPSLNELLNSNP